MVTWKPSKLFQLPTSTARRHNLKSHHHGDSLLGSVSSDQLDRYQRSDSVVMWQKLIPHWGKNLKILKRCGTQKRRQAEFCHSPFSNLCHSLDGRKAYLKEKNLAFHQMFILIFQHKQCSQIRRRISAEGQTFICKLRREANMSAVRTVILDPLQRAYTHTYTNFRISSFLTI